MRDSHYLLNQANADTTKVANPIQNEGWTTELPITVAVRFCFLFIST